MARKFLVVDDAQGGGTSRHEQEVPDTALRMNNVDLGVSGTAGSLDIFPATAASGKLTIAAADSAGDTTTTITNASQAGARTYTIPDAGASANFVMSAGAQTLAGTYTFTSPVVEDHNTGITAFATGGQASAVALTGRWNNVTTCATAGDSVKLLTAVAGQVQTVKNSGATTLAVFPNTSDAINALAVDLSVDIPPGGELTFRAIDGTTWETIESLYLSAPTTQTGGLEIKAADSAGNTTTTVTNASQAAARTYTIPDAGASASFLMTAGDQSVSGVQTLTAGAAAAAIAMRFGASITEGLEIRVIDEVVATGAINNDLTEDVPTGSVIISVQSNVETALTGGGTTVNYGIGTAGDPDKYSPTVGALTLDAKTDALAAYTVLSGAEDIQVNGVTAAGVAGDTALTVGTVRVRIVYLALNSLDNA